MTRLLQIITLLAALALPARAATVTATIDPPQVSLGDSAQLTVTVTGSQEQPTVPSVSGLNITAVGQSTQIEIVNGSITANASITYSVTPDRVGNFVIPAIRVAGASSPPITLQVGQGNSTSPSPAPAQTLPPPQIANVPNAGPVVLPPQNSVPSPNNDSSLAARRFGFIRVTLPRKEFYVGELVPVDIKAYVPSDLQANVDDAPQMIGDNFSLNQLGTRPDRTEEVVGNRDFTVLTWHSALTGVKAGDFPFNMEMPMTVIVPGQIPQMDGQDPFNNFFRNAFASMGQKQDVKIESGQENLRILPVPETGRPANFTGAVGQFDLDVSASPTQVNVGDPITLRLKISGRGNFDRVSTDGLASDANWKTYSTKSHFDAADSVGYQGTKTFEQPVIANNSGVTAIPSLTFSFFDPETRQFVTRSAPPISVAVTGAAPSPAPIASTSQPGTPAATPPSNPPAATPTPSLATDLAMNKVEPGTFVPTLRPVYLSPIFLGAQALPLVALVAGFGLIRRQRHISQPQRIRASAMEQAVRQQIAAMDEALRNRQSNAFFVHARTALQHRFGHLWNVRPEAITAADVDAHLGDQGSHIRPVFEMADQASYSGLHFEESDLADWRQVVINELAEKR